MRMVPINTETPKALLTVDGEVLIERQIRQLQEVGITKIDVVVGFMKERFEYLMDDFGVNLIVNPLYASHNNISSLAVARSLQIHILFHVTYGARTTHLHRMNCTPGTWSAMKWTKSPM